MSTGEKYSTGIVEMIRNNNIAIGKSKMDGYNTYFMLDYFDLLFHRELHGKDKIYRKFWNIKQNKEDKELNYKAAYKTLSLYAPSDKVKENFFEVHAEAGTLSARPFLGIIQINFVHYLYTKSVCVEELFRSCEQEIMEALHQNISQADTCYQMYRSSTSGDFCLAVKSANVEEIYKISTLINNFVVHYGKESYKFNTYTNVGIECFMDDNGRFFSFRKDTVEKNSCCKFAVRITTYHEFAERIFGRIDTSKEIQVTVEPMDGLFGRYDFLLYLSMEEFAQIYDTLCASKIIGCKENVAPGDDEGITLIQLFRAGIREGKIKIINERVLVPLSGALFDLKDVDINSGQFKDKENTLLGNVRNSNKALKEKMKQLQKMEYLFVEERRCFIDITRELWEVISTYVPQGMDDDSHVNWQILVNDLRAAFEAIEQWKNSYEKCMDPIEQKEMRGVFLDDLRLITDAVNQYYKFLQNVNSQTWQSPLYEIQTQLDAEKMMIAYRDFLYEYLCHYKENYSTPGDRRPVFYPIVYPDMSTENVCVSAPFSNEMGLYRRLLICRVPSFEYYGRVFDMLPWILHEASHHVRALKREDRNKYLIDVTVEAVFSQAVYKLLNQYSNDYGYHALGILENEVLECITKAASERFRAFCHDREIDLSKTGINYLEMELIEFMNTLFTHKIYHMDEGEDTRNIKAIQKALLQFLASQGQLESKGNAVIDLVQQCSDNEDKLSAVLKLIYDTCYFQISGEKPEENSWEMLKRDSGCFEKELAETQEELKKRNVSAAQLQDYCFSTRELNRLYVAWYKRQKRNDNSKKAKDDLWRSCIVQIRNTVRKGFEANKGFTELYRIFNMIFGSGEFVSDTDIERVGREFDILLQEEVHTLVEREGCIYGESYADIFMTATLGLDAFGYCRQMFQTASETAKEDSTKWTEAINVHRFRVVTAVLLSEECPSNGETVGKNRYISTDTLLQRGKQYCLASLKCAQNSILRELKGGTEEEREEKTRGINLFFKMLEKNIHYIFEYFGYGIPIKEFIEDSLLSVCLNHNKPIDTDDPQLEEKREGSWSRYRAVQDELDKCRHIIYRVKCFIVILSMLGEDGKIYIREDEYRHLRDLYKIHLSECEAVRKAEICRVVSEYYNEPSSAHTKSAAEMLDDTIQFIQTYYYKNRFSTMTSNTDMER